MKGDKVVEIGEKCPDCILLILFCRNRDVEICKITAANSLPGSTCKACVRIAAASGR